MAGAIACVAVALFLYVVGTLVLGLDDEGSEGLLSAVHMSAPPAGAIE